MIIFCKDRDKNRISTTDVAEKCYLCINVRDFGRAKPPPRGLVHSRESLENH